MNKTYGYEVRRTQFIEAIVRQVEAQGWCDVSLLSSDMDDPPRHPILEFALRLHEIQTRGHDIEPVKTLRGELVKECAARQWQIVESIQECGGRIRIIAPPRRITCQQCEGTGREKIRITEYEGPMFVVKICDACSGRGDRLSVVG